jgi:hypothetical protein
VFAVREEQRIADVEEDYFGLRHSLSCCHAEG